MLAKIINIQHYAIHDGDGIRTLVFFKGCSLRCLWCANPESQEFYSEFFFAKDNCLNCGDCRTIRDKLKNLKDFSSEKLDYNSLDNLCPSKALSVCGRDYSVSEIMDEVEKDRLFYRNNGGLTLSGGEPLLQWEFVSELLKAAKSSNINTAVESCLYLPKKNLVATVPYIDTLLVDVKHIDSNKYRTFTGGDLSVFFQNFSWLQDQSIKIIARIPVIPGFNDNSAEISSILDYLARFPAIKEVSFMPFHNLASGKCELLGRDWFYSSIKSTPCEDLEYLVLEAAKRDLKATIGG